MLIGQVNKWQLNFQFDAYSDPKTFERRKPHELEKDATNRRLWEKKLFNDCGCVPYVVAKRETTHYCRESMEEGRRSNEWWKPFFQATATTTMKENRRTGCFCCYVRSFDRTEAEVAVEQRKKLGVEGWEPRCTPSVRPSVRPSVCGVERRRRWMNGRSLGRRPTDGSTDRQTNWGKQRKRSVSKASSGRKDIIVVVHQKAKKDQCLHFSVWPPDYFSRLNEEISDKDTEKEKQVERKGCIDRPNSIINCGLECFGCWRKFTSSLNHIYFIKKTTREAPHENCERKKERKKERKSVLRHMFIIHCQAMVKWGVRGVGACPKAAPQSSSSSASEDWMLCGWSPQQLTGYSNSERYLSLLVLLSFCVSLLWRKSDSAYYNTPSWRKNEEDCCFSPDSLFRRRHFSSWCSSWVSRTAITTTTSSTKRRLNGQGFNPTGKRASCYHSRKVRTENEQKSENISKGQLMREKLSKSIKGMKYWTHFIRLFFAISILGSRILYR